jgi:hypothetical protein
VLSPRLHPVDCRFRSGRITHDTEKALPRPSGQDQAATLRLRNWIAKLFGRVDPKTNGVLRAAEGVFLCRAVRGASRKFWHFGDEGPIFFAPVDDDFVFAYKSASASLYFKITSRTCFTDMTLHSRLWVED